LVYDGRTPWLRAAAAALGRGTDLVPVRWESAPVQAFLDAQFNSRPFAFVLVEGDSVHVGSETVGRVLERYGLCDRTVALFERAYPVVSGPFGRAVHGREPAALDGTFELTDRARRHVDRLRRSYEVPVTEG
jgi:hypothetical protein